MTDQTQSLAVRPTVTAGGQVAGIIPQDIEQAWRLSEAFAKSGMTPRGITEPAQIMLVICGGAEVGFGPFQALQAFALINNRLCLWGDAVPALLLSRGIKIREWFENEDTSYPDNMTAMCEITRLDGQMFLGKFSVKDAKDAKLWTKTGPWQEYRRRMLQMRARGFGARDGAPDVLRGMAIAEEVRDMPPEVTAANNEPQALSAEFSDGPAALPAPEEKKTRKTSKAPAPIEPIEPTTAKEATPEPEPQPEPATEILSEPQEQDNVHAGPAPRDVTYILASEEPGEDDKIQTYKNGEVFSRVKASEQALTTTPIYDTHPEPAVEPEPETETEQPEEEEEAEADMPAEFQSYIDAVEAAPTWGDFKKAMQGFYGSALFKSWGDGQQNKVRSNTWDVLVESAVADKPDPALDPSAFRLWVEWIDDADAITGTLSVLHDAPKFKEVPDSTKDVIDGAAKARIAALS